MIMATALAETTYAYWHGSRWLCGHDDPPPSRLRIAEAGLREIAGARGRLAAAAGATLRLRGLTNTFGERRSPPPGGDAA